MKKISHTATYKWQLLLQGGEQEFYECFHNCYDDLYRLGIYLYKDAELAKECIQLLFIELWKIRGNLPEVSNVKEYVLTIYKRLLYKQKLSLANHWSTIMELDNTTDFEGSFIASYEEMLIASQESERLQSRLGAVLQQLSQRQKELIRLRYFEEKSIEEIAAITSLAPRTIYNTLYNALEKLKELMAAAPLAKKPNHLKDLLLLLACFTT